MFNKLWFKKTESKKTTKEMQLTEKKNKQEDTIKLNGE